MPDFRHLPPVEPVTWPDRLSQTLLKHHDRCPRAGYLYVKHGGGPASLPMDRGSAFHVFAERMMLELITEGQQSLYAPQLGEDTVLAKEGVASLTATMVDEILSARPDLVVPADGADAVRLMAYHTAIGLDVNPEHVVGVERKFVLDLDCGWTVSGKVDLASLPEVGGGQVDDFKTSLHVPSDEANPFQRKLYSVLLVYGQPVEEWPCQNCSIGGGLVTPDYAASLMLKEPCTVCGDRRVTEHRLDPIGGHLRWVRGRELYPRYLRRDGSIQRIEQTWTRLELEEFRIDLERAGRMISERLETWDFPARSDPSWCNECPAEPECPLPAKLREFAGHIGGAEHAGEVLSWAQRAKERAADAEAEVKAWAKANDAVVPMPSGHAEYAFEVSPTRKMKTGPDRKTDFDGLALAIEGAVERGDPFDIRDWIKEGKRNTFKKRVLDPDVVVPSEVVPPSAEDLDERFGAEAPWD